MSKIGLNIIHSFPVNNINSDENRVPKNAQIYGVNRVYQSSQCWNRAIRDTYFNGVVTAYNTKNIDELVTSVCKDSNVDTTKIDICVSVIHKFLTGSEIKKTKNTDKKGTVSTDTTESNSTDKKDVLLKVSVVGIRNMIKYILGVDENKIDNKELEKCYKNVDDGDVIAFFGNMNANNAELNVDSIVQTAHAFTTHTLYPFGNLYTAMDDYSFSSTGAGHLGRSYFNSGTFYRSIIIDVDKFKESTMMSLNPDHTANLAEKKNKLAKLIRSCLTAVPSGSSAKAEANTTCNFVVGLTSCNPFSYSDAFAKPIVADEDTVQNSVDKLTKTIESKNSVYELSTDAIVALHDVCTENHSGIIDAANMTEFINTLIDPCFK